MDLALQPAADCNVPTLRDVAVSRASPQDSLLPLWIFLGTTALALLLQVGDRLAIPFLVASAGLALWSMHYRPRLYFALTTVLYLCTPLVRRIQDFESSYHDPSIILAAPLLVSLLSFAALPALLRHTGKLKSIALLPFSMALLAVLYGFAIGAFKSLPIELVRPGLEWLAPLAFGAYCFFHAAEHHFLPLLENITITAIISLGIYALVQFLNPLPWDLFWLLNFNQTHFQPSFGRPERFGIRLFATLNAPQTFAALLAFAFPLLFTLRSNILAILTLPLLLLCLALTQSRSQLLTVVVASVLLALILRTRALLRLGILFAILAATVGIGAVSSDMANKIGDRLESFNNLKSDESAIARSNGMRLALEMIATEPFGQGVGFPDGDAFERSDLSTKYGVDTHDLGIVEVGVSFGYLGGLLYVGGFAFALFLIARAFYRGAREHAGVLVAVFSSLAALGTVNLFLGLSGIWLWSAIGCLLGSSAALPSPAASAPAQAANLHPVFEGVSA